MQRLSRAQYANALEDLLSRALPVADVRAALAPRLAALPVDGSTARSQITYDSEDQRISTVLVEPQVELATQTAEWIVTNPTRLAAFTRTFGGAACSTPTDAGCPDALIAGLGLRALRRPLDAADIAVYRAAFDDSTYGGFRGLIAALLLAPDFLFRPEVRGEAVDARSDLTRLTSYEIASRVSFALTNSAPDDELLDAASNDFTTSTLDAEIARLLSTPRARAQMESYHRQWLRYDRVPSFNPSAVAALEVDYPEGSAPNLPRNMDLDALREAAFEEMVALMSYYTFDAPNGSMRDVLTSSRSFARGPQLTAVYGVRPWSGAANDQVDLPDRSGLFTRAGYLISGYPDTNPVMRGARLRVEYLCDLMVPPADTSPPTSYMPPAVPTVRNEVTAKTQIPNTACQSCHAPSINPLGFTFEIYDALGRFRHQEPLTTGGWAPVDAATMPNINRDGSTVPAADARVLSAQLAESPRFHACFARHTFRYLMGRREVEAQDGCVLASMERASRTGSIQDVVRALVRAPELSLHKLPAGN